MDRLLTDRLMLRPLDSSDKSEWTRVQKVSTERFARWFPRREGELNDWFEEDLKRSEAGWNDGSSFRWAAFLKDGRLVGFFALNNVVRRAFQNAYAGWAVSSDVEGRGLATEGVRALLDLAFWEHGAALHRVQANIIPSNAASLRIAAKVGMREEGLAQRYLKIADEWQDHRMFAKTSEEHEFCFVSP